MTAGNRDAVAGPKQSGSELGMTAADIQNRSSGRQVPQELECVSSLAFQEPAANVAFEPGRVPFRSGLYIGVLGDRRTSKGGHGGGG
jgi:hypothetical protein